MSQRTAYLKYRASHELDSLVANYIRDMEGPYARGTGKPDPANVMRIMDLFVAESVNVLALDAVDTIGLGPTAKKLVHGLASMVKSTGNLLVGRVVKGFNADQHRRVAAYMKSLRQVSVEDGREVGDISFPLAAALAEQGWATGRLAIESGGNHPQLLPEGIRFLHAMSDVAMFWVFEEPVRQIGVSGLTATVVGGTVRSVKATSLTVIDKVIPHVNPHQLALAAEYYASLLRTGPYLAQFGAVTGEPLFEKQSA